MHSLSGFPSTYHLPYRLAINSQLSLLYSELNPVFLPYCNIPITIILYKAFLTLTDVSALSETLEPSISETKICMKGKKQTLF